MRVLVTGHDGFTGEPLCKELQNKGHDLLFLSQNLDIRNMEDVQQFINKHSFDAVIHLAAISFVPDAKNAQVYDINTMGTEHLLQAIRNKNCSNIRNIILASTAQVYGPKEGILKEDDPLAPNNHYALSKYAMEQVAKNFMDDLPITLVRPFNYTGATQDKKFFIPKIVHAFATKQKSLEVGNLEVMRDFSDVRWVSSVYASLIEQADIAGKSFNIASGKAIKLTDVIQMMSDISQHQCEIRVNPDFVRANEVQIQYGDITELTRYISPSPYSFNDTLHWMYKYNLEGE